MAEHDVIVVGAGPAGIAAGIALEDAGISPLIVDRAEAPVSAWRSRYDRLRLNSSRWFSHLPGRRFEKGTPMFPSRDQFIEYLEWHAREAGLDFRFGAEVERIERRDGGWTVRSTAGEMIAPQVVLATGHQGAPVIPEWDGRESYSGTLLHSAAYRNAEPFRGKSVLVVGSGCSGMEIAYELSEDGASKVWLAVRTPPNIVLREGPGGLPGDLIGVTLLRAPVRLADSLTAFGRRMDLGDLSQYGLPAPDEGLFARLQREGTVPAIVDREVIEAIKARRIEVVGAVEALEGTEVRLAEGKRIEPEAIICATGYRTTLEPLVGHLGVLDERGQPLSQGARAPAPGMRFLGYITRPGAIGYVGRQARAIAKAIRRELRRARPGQAPARESTKAASSSPA